MKELSVIVPTFNEKDNITILADRVSRILKNIDHEIIIIDDNSPDGTWKVAEKLQESYSNIKCIRRIGRRGLSSAVIEGVLLSKSKYIVVLDADLQHDESVIPEMLNQAKDSYDLIVASRYTFGGSTANWGSLRLKISKTATALTRIMFKHNLEDPMSGFFLINRNTFIEQVENLDGKGFKILLDILSNYTPNEISVKEIPYTFNKRRYGESKLNFLVILEFFDFIYNKKFGKYIPLLFFKYSVVGCIGALIHFLILFINYKIFQAGYNTSLAIAIELTIIFNFFFNNIWTFTYKIIRGFKIFTGLLKYNISCMFGGFINIAMSNYLIEIHLHWTVASLIGALVASSWNYNLSKIITWDYYFD